MPVLQSFSYMMGLDDVAIFQVGNGAGEL